MHYRSEMLKLFLLLSSAVVVEMRRKTMFPLQSYVCNRLSASASEDIIIACSSSKLADPNKEYEEGDRFFYFPGDDDDGIVRLIDTQRPVDKNILTDNEDDNAYWLFTSKNPKVSQNLDFNNTDSVRTSNFDGTKDTVFLVHGWLGDGRNQMNQLLKKAFLLHDVNVIVLDWHRLANCDYLTAVAGVPKVGRNMGRFIKWLTTLGLSLDKTHLVGFSLGGHVVGNTGRELGGDVKRITALDPAGALWGYNSNRLVKTDAKYVEVIHTSIAGLRYPLGDADFYPNGGRSMPGCDTFVCSHRRAFWYMAATVAVKHDLLGKKCRNFDEMYNDNCIGDLQEMGNSNLNKSSSGIFRVPTGSGYPYHLNPKLFPMKITSQTHPTGSGT